MGIIDWLGRKSREAEIRMLWNICLDVAGHREVAKRVFLWHARHDPAWTERFSEAELCQFVSDL